MCSSGLAREKGRGVFQDLAFFTEDPVLAAMVLKLLALGDCDAVLPAPIDLGLRDPAAHR